MIHVFCYEIFCMPFFVDREQQFLRDFTNRIYPIRISNKISENTRAEKNLREIMGEYHKEIQHEPGRNYNPKEIQE